MAAEGHVSSTNVAPDTQHTRRRIAELAGLSLALAAGLVGMLLLMTPLVDAGVPGTGMLMRLARSLPMPATHNAPIGRSDSYVGEGIALILARPEDFYNRQVLVTGRVKRMVGQAGFILGGDEGTDVGSLLVMPEPGVVPVVSNTAILDMARVYGTVERFETRAIEKKTRQSLDHALFVPWSGGPVLIASVISLRVPEPGQQVDRVLDAGRPAAGAEPGVERSGSRLPSEALVTPARRPG